MTVHLISENTLKKYTLINDNVDAAYIGPAIQKAQDMGLQPIIGSNLYDKLCDLVKNGTIAQQSNAQYKALLDEYVTPYLCNKVTADIQIPLFAKLRNAGIVQSQDQQTQQLSINEVEYVRKNYEHTANFYGERLTSYLCTNNNQFPEYRTKRNAADLQADSSAFSTHIVL